MTPVHDRMQAALRLIAEISKRSAVHLGRARFSGIAQDCVHCIAKLGLSQPDEAEAADFDARRAAIMARDTDVHEQPVVKPEGTES